MPKDLHQDSREGQEGKFKYYNYRVLIIEKFRFDSK